MKYVKLSVMIVLLLMLASCSRWSAYEKELAAADKALFEADLLDVNVMTDISINDHGSINSVSDEVSFSMSIDPYFIYIEDPEPSIIYENEGYYYQANLGSPLTDTGYYVIAPNIVNVEMAESFSNINVEGEPSYQFIDGKIEETEDHVFQITTTFKNLLEDQSFADLATLEDLMTSDQYDAFLASEVIVTVDFNQGIKMMLNLSMDIEDIAMTISLTMDIKIAQGEAVDVLNDERFLILETSDIMKATEIFVDHPFSYPENWDLYTQAYFKIYLEEGHYYINASSPQMYPTFMDLNYQNYNLIDMIENRLILENYPYRAIKIDQAGYYYFSLFINGYEASSFSIDHLDYDSYLSDSTMDITNGGTYSFEIEGLHDAVAFEYTGSSNAIIGIDGLGDHLSFFTIQNVSISSFYNQDKNAISVTGPTTVYLIPFDEYGIKTYTVTFEVFYQSNNFTSLDQMYTLTSTFDHMFVASDDLASQYVKLEITEEGDYAFYKNNVYNDIGNIGTIYDESNQVIKAVNNYTGSSYQLAHLVPGTYYLQLVAFNPSVFQLRYEKIS
ncbi:MAG: hypothetical protein AB7E61_06700 [Acholeplasmataceae bacterium]